MNIDFKKAPVFTSHILSGSSFTNFWKVLADNKFKIEARFLPKLLMTFLIILLNIPFVWLEKLLFSSAIKKTVVKNPVFILGYPRSGTTYLMYLLSRDPQFAFCKTYECMGPHVIFTFGRVLRIIGRLVLPKKRPMDNMELGAEVPKEEEFALGNMCVATMATALYFPKRFSEYFDHTVLFRGNEKVKKEYKKELSWFLQKLTLKHRGKRMLLKSPFNTGRLKMLLELYPDAKFIHIHRHPYTVFSSNEKLYESVLPLVSFHTIGNEEMENHLFDSYKATMENYFRERNLAGKNQLFEMSYDAFVANPVELLKNIYSQLELGNLETALPIIEKEVKNSKNYKTNKHQDDAVKKQRVFEKWGFAYEMLGYGK